jgi:hypothetical protein
MPTESAFLFACGLGLIAIVIGVIAIVAIICGDA